MEENKEVMPEEAKEVQKKVLTIEDIPLEEDDLVRLTITEKKDGTILIHSNVAEGEAMTPAQLVGLLEVSKFDILNQQAQRSGGAPMPPQVPMDGQPEISPEDVVPTDVTLEECDFKAFPELETHMGFEAGQTIQLPKMTVDRLIEARTAEDCGCSEE